MAEELELGYDLFDAIMNAREKQAKNLAYTLGIVMARLEGDLERYVKDNSGGGDIEVRLDGGSNWK